MEKFSSVKKNSRTQWSDTYFKKENISGNLASLTHKSSTFKFTYNTGGIYKAH